MISGTESELLQEIESLRETVEELKAVLSASSRVTMQAIQQGPFLGQPVTIIVTAMEGRGNSPRVNVPITVTTTWGRLRVAAQSEVELNNTVTAHTDLNGRVEVILAPPTTEEILDLQQAALEAELSMLDSNANTPTETQAAFQEMARKYTWEAEADLRDAVNIYFRDFRNKLFNTINTRDFMQQWLYFDSTVIAYAIDDRDEPGSLVQGTALLTLKFKDWIGPWLEAYLKLAEAENTLESGLKETARKGSRADAMNEVYGRVTEFLEGHPGVVGEYVGRRTAEKVLTSFAATDLAEVPSEVKVFLNSATMSATTELSRGNIRHLTGLFQSRSAVEDEMVANVNSQIKKFVTVGLIQVKTETDKSLEKHEIDLKDVRTRSALAHQGELGGVRQRSSEAHAIELVGAEIFHGRRT